MIFIAEILGAPVMLPIGKVNFKTSIEEYLESNFEVIVEII